MLIEKYLSGSYSYLITFKEDKTSYLNLASSLLNSKKGIGGDYLLVVNKETKEIEMYNDKEKEKNYISAVIGIAASVLALIVLGPSNYLLAAMIIIIICFFYLYRRELNK